MFAVQSDLSWNVGRRNEGRRRPLFLPHWLGGWLTAGLSPDPDVSQTLDCSLEHEGFSGNPRALCTPISPKSQEGEEVGESHLHKHILIFQEHGMVRRELCARYRYLNVSHIFRTNFAGACSHNQSLAGEAVGELIGEWYKWGGVGEVAVVVVVVVVGGEN
ncbi:unnamed protein product [Pleuronectes platessa]|uniref:Uncharacterized protein n=1 Tax=Pleuronectes platessa TaxID=8262 RepID=A0A9N7TNK2_PLEPL|nr:unnamed protein product [Pleuronectes platessa]